MHNYLLIIFGILSSALAQIMLKKSGEFNFFSESSFFKYFIMGGIFYGLSFGLYAYLLKIFTLSKISPVMTIGTMLIVVFAGVVVFRENVSIRQIIGVLVGVVSIILILK